MSRGFWAAAVALSLGLGGSAAAQWSVGAPGSRVPPKGLNRYAFFVLTNPIAGHEQEFNIWYDMQHQGDLGQLKGWIGSQRFRLAGGMDREQDTARYPFGYLVQWDWESDASAKPLAEAVKAIRGGKSRLGPGFNYAPGASINIVYRALGPRLARPDGHGNTMPAADDYHTPRANRYMLAEFVTPSAGVDDGAMTRAMQARAPRVLGVAGFNSAQLFRYEPTADIPGFPPTPPLPGYLTIWEIEAPSATAAQQALAAAEASGAVPRLPIDRQASRALYWEPSGPYVTRDMFAR